MRFFGNKHIAKSLIFLLTVFVIFFLVNIIFVSHAVFAVESPSKLVLNENDNSNRTIIVKNSGEKISFETEIADTPLKRTKGLMFRTHLPQNQGMIFISEKDQVWSMWMKNTLIELDMVYFNRAGDIVKIIKNAIPQDESILSSDFPVAGVLEVGGGITDKYKINVGDKISSPLIK